jgi:hypothetical protein
MIITAIADINIINRTSAALAADNVSVLDLSYDAFVTIPKATTQRSSNLS